MAWQWWKRAHPGFPLHYPGRMEVEEYHYTPGRHGLEFAKALREGRILGMKCGDAVLVPPKTFCPDQGEGQLVEVRGPWRIQHYTVIHETIEGERLGEPVIVAVIKPDDAANGLIHIVKADPSRVYPGMKVRPVWRPPEERRGLITDILYWEPADG